jgi:uncharacterized membrane protein
MAAELPKTTKKNIESVAEIEKALHRQRSTVDRISDRITAFAGSLSFVAVHVTVFIVWVVLNTLWLTGVLKFEAFDPYPYVFLNLVLSLESVFLTSFVLISQNRQARQAEQWAHVGLQIGLLSEQETTKMLQLLQAICGRLEMPEAGKDRELKEMVQKTHVHELVEHLEKARDIEEPTH